MNQIEESSDLSINHSRETVIILDDAADARNVYLATGEDLSRLQAWLAERDVDCIRDFRQGCFQMQSIFAALDQDTKSENVLLLLHPPLQAAVRSAALALPHRILSVPAPVNVTVVHLAQASQKLLAN
jgi:hypothetical protein